MRPTNLHLSFDGLAGQGMGVVGRDPLSGHLFVFFNRRRDQVKVLYWDRTGYCVWSKRLERGRYRTTWLAPGPDGSVEVEAAEMGLLLEGIDLSKARKRPRWEPGTARALL